MGYFMTKNAFVAEVTLNPTLFVTRTRLGCCYGKKNLLKNLLIVANWYFCP